MKAQQNATAAMVQQGLLELLFKQSAKTFPLSAIGSVITVIVLWNQVSHALLLGWVLLICACNMACFILIKRFKQKSEDAQQIPSFWMKRYQIITFIVGMAWGVGALLFMQQASIPYQFFILMVLAGACGSSLVAQSASTTTFAMIIFPCMLIPGTWLLMQGDPLHVAAGLLAFLFVILTWSLSRKQFQVINEAMVLRYKNSDLLGFLEAEVTERRINEERLLQGEQALKQKTQQMKSLLRLAKLLEQADNYGEIISAVAGEIKQSMGFKTAWIYRAGKDADVYQLLTVNGDKEPPITDECKELHIQGDTFLEKIAVSDETVVIEDAQTDPRTNKKIVTILGTRTIINTPIILSKKRLGILGTGSFGDEGVRVPEISQLEHLSAMSSHVAVAMDRIRLSEERRDMQKQLEHTQRLESLGVLAGGIAHDFNNILTAILGSASIAAVKLERDPKAVQIHLNNIVNCSQRAADLCKQMLAYSGKGSFIIEVVDLSRIVEDMAPLLEASTEKHAEISYLLHDELSMIEVDIAQIQQVIMNLVINASDAIDEKSGRVIISSGEMYADEEFLAQCYGESPQPGNYVFLEVADTGCGMDSDTQGKVFDPFFTTKFTGHGLGMSAILGIVRGHKGAIYLDSTPAVGTTFRVLFPVSDKKQTMDEDRLPRVPTAADHVRGTVLVIDDEEVLREVATTVLESTGFDVLTAAHGEEGVEVYRRHQQDIKLVLLDLTMPRMSGKDCFHALTRINASVKVIIISGYSEEEAISQFDQSSLAGFIQKPYLPNTLTAKVCEAITIQ